MEHVTALAVARIDMPAPGTCARRVARIVFRNLVVYVGSKAPFLFPTFAQKPLGRFGAFLGIRAEAVL
jgi:hypothetical protein